MLNKSADTLANLLFHDCTLQEMLNACENILGNPIRFTPSGRFEESISSKGYPQVDMQETINLKFRSSNTIVDSKEYFSFVSPAEFAQHGDRPFLVQREGLRFVRKLCYVSIGEKCFGHISVPAIFVSIEELDDDIISTLAHYIALACINSGLPSSPLSSDLALEQILSGDISSYAELASKVAGIPPYNQACRLIVAPLILQHTSAAILPIQEKVTQVIQKSWCAYFNGNLVILVPSEKLPTARQLENLHQALYPLNCPIGIGIPFHDIMQSVKQLNYLLAIPKLQTAAAHETIYLYDHIEAAFLAEVNLSSLQLRELCSPILLDMQRHDEKHNTQYVETMRTYFTCSFSATVTARMMHVHVNTILYRINQMQRLFEFDINNNNAVFHLMFSFRLLQYQLP